MKFSEWFKSKWIETGGLITQSTAARILETSDEYIRQISSKGEIKKYYVPENKNKKLAYVSLQDVIKKEQEMRSKKPRTQKNAKQEHVNFSAILTPKTAKPSPETTKN